MKRLSLIVAFLITFAATAQQNNIQSAIRSLNYEPMKYSDLENAKDAIDKAAENELTANDPKMWF
ncbi:MAG: hypothetical protein RL021_1501, partial [Bacteroidota bacterium]